MQGVIRQWASFVAGLLVSVSSASEPLNPAAVPGRPTVVHGMATFSQPAPATLNITNSPSAIINWQSFNIPTGHTTRFIQPGADSAVLNRVTGQQFSDLQGALRSNGRVYLINPNGVVIGSNAVIDTAGFIASTLDMSDEDFIAGQLAFRGDSGAAIENHGLIRVRDDGNVVLIAASVRNSGSISTDGGNLVLAAGEAVTITSLDNPALQYEVTAPAHT
ncbi:MAG: filamentous hemagglutinin N-terminal domain-containing protein, partial [Gammaproteobacteria bacterium]|nr:filamentous hemagglutinin N-terminal domain-containing protein [Gammaproteobacteria bacterium]